MTILKTIISNSASRDDLNRNNMRLNAQNKRVKSKCSGSYFSPGTRHPLRGRAALQVTAHPGSGPAMLGALWIWQSVAALPAPTQHHAVPVAGTTAGRALQTERGKGERRITKKERENSGRKARRWRSWEGATPGSVRSWLHKKKKLNLNLLSRGPQLYRK